jgi:chemotaxis protein CheD
VNLVVGVSDMRLSNDPEATLVTYSLGSCIAVAIYDPVARAGGLLHFMLPDSSLDPEKAQRKPFMFADTGIPLLFKGAYKLGAKKNRMQVVVVGGAQVSRGEDFFNIGKRNYLAVRKIFWRNNVLVNFKSVGGNNNRTLRLKINDGRILLKESANGQLKYPAGSGR